MRVLHVIPGIAPRYGGPSVAVVALCRSLARHGVDCCIATTDADGVARLDVPHGQLTSYEGVAAIFFPRQWSEAFKISLPLSRWLGAHVADFDVVEIHAVFSHASLAAARACRRRRVPYVVRPLGSLAPWSLARKAWRKRALSLLGVKRMLAEAAAIHYTSEGERRQAEAGASLARGVVVPLPMEEAGPLVRMATLPWGEGSFVLALGRLHEKKGLDLLIEAFARATRDADLGGWRLVLAGDGETAWVEHLREVARRAAVASRVVFPGWISGDTKRAALASAALLVLPSRQENFALAAMEALAHGVPVLLSPQVDLAEELQAAGAAWVAPLDRDALAAGLRQALSHEAERSERGRRGRDWVHRNLSPDVVGARLLAFYESLTDTTQRSDR